MNMKTSIVVIIAVLILFLSENIFPQVTDIDGNVYKTVTIGNQVWTAENLDVSHYRNGDTIMQVDGNTEWEAQTSGGWCYFTLGSYNFYKDNLVNGECYGKLYNWYAVNDPRGLAPEGWHIPTPDDWKQLLDYLGGYEVAGSMMKTYATWQSPTDKDINSSGFTIIYAGIRTLRGMFLDFDKYAYFWTANEDKDGSSWCYNLYAESTIFAIYTEAKEHGLSVRLVKD